MKVAVVGASGQLGSDLVRVFREAAKYEILPLVHTQIEITDRESVERVLADVHPDVVINCAAFHRVDECEERPEEGLHVNALGALHVADACSRLGALCVYISTDYVFEGKKRTPYAEDDTASPVSIYGIAKLAGEHLVRNVCPRHFVVRTSGLYGVAGSSGKGGNFVETMIRLAKEAKPIRVVNDQVLTPTYTKDLARKMHELLENEAYGLYHITNAGSCSWYEFAGKVFELLNIKPDFGPTSTAAYRLKARRPEYSVLARERLVSLGLDDLRPWRDALEAYLKEKGHLTA